MVKIITDSSCDMSLEKCRELGIEVIPIGVHFGEESYEPGINLTNKEFYDKLANVTQLPTTTQISPVKFEEVFKHHVDNGNEVVGMFISRELSGTYSNAVMVAKRINEDKIHVVDTLNTTFGLALLLHEAVKMREEGFTAKEIAQKITELVPRVTLFAGIETLKYLKMGGRLSAGAAMVAGVLGICPIISVVKGKVEAVGKARGRAASNKFIEDQVKKIGISSDYAVSFGHSNAPELCIQTEKIFADYINKKNVIRTEIGPVIGTHIGAGASGIAFIKK